MESNGTLEQSIKENSNNTISTFLLDTSISSAKIKSNSKARSTTTMEQVALVNVKNGPTQYRVVNGSDYYLVGEVPLVGILPSGCYVPSVSDSGYFLKTVSVNTDRLLKLPYKVFHDVLRDLNVFWDSINEFKRYGLVHKRGILLYGPPGSGKSSLVLLVQKLIIENLQGIVVTVTSKGDLECFIGFMENGFRQVEPDRPVVVLLEDIDGLVSSSSTEALLLQVLDGAKQINNIVYLATTNYLYKLEARLTNRPSRFDRVYEIGFPDADIRKFYLENIILPEDRNKVDIAEWVSKSDGFTFAHLRDIIVSVLLLKISFEETIDHLKGLGDKAKKSLQQGSTEIGFGKSLGSKSDMDYYNGDENEVCEGESLSDSPSSEKMYSNSGGCGIFTTGGV